MKLKEFNTENLPVVSRRDTVPKLGIQAKTGIVIFNPPAIDLLQIKDGDTVVFHQDEEDKVNWYVEVVGNSPKGFKLRIKKPTNYLMFNSTSLARRIFESVDFTGKSGSILIAGEPTVYEKKRKLHGLITVSLLNR